MDNKKVYEGNIVLLDDIFRMIDRFRCQDFYIGNKLLRKVNKEIVVLINWIIDNEEEIYTVSGYICKEYIINILQMLESSQKNDDFILIADIFEQEIYPFIMEIQKIIITNLNEVISDKLVYNMEKCADKDLCKLIMEFDELQNFESVFNIEPTNSGEVTVRYVLEEKSKYLHSNINPRKEAQAFARQYYDSAVLEYTVYGMGLGYHISEMLRLDKRIKINIVESNFEIIYLAFKYADLSEILLSGRVKIIYKKTFDHLKTYLKEQNTFVIHYPSLALIEDAKIREVLEDYFIKQSSVLNQGKLLRENLYYNLQEEFEYIDVLRDSFKSKDMILVAAGPSLEDSIEELKKIKDNNVIIVSVGTVAKKIMDNGIIPDYIVISDAQENLDKQLLAINSDLTKLIFLSSASNNAVRVFKGKKYMVCQNGYEEAEKIAKEHRLTLFETGGSVSTLILDIGLRFKCKRIICVGLDLALTKEKGHAFEEADIDISVGNVRKVQGVNNEMLYTKKNLDIYRKWIENRIVNESIKIINTSNGAKIEGMINCKLSSLKL